MDGNNLINVGRAERATCRFNIFQAIPDKDGLDMSIN